VQGNSGIDVSRTPELEKYVQEKVSSGLYYFASEVIREGLRLLKEREQLQQIRLQELRQRVRAESGEAEFNQLVEQLIKSI
jgi:antitoxin ParD1/3/4